ncbi:MAG: acyl--CoA ligase [Acidimicrobiia bacterium]|nr:acyl--CoA ligase [Acidimicrobiia bacterium]
MISSVLPAHDPVRPFLLDRATDGVLRELSYGECRSRVDELVRSHRDLRGARVGLRATAERETVLWLLALDALGARGHLVPPSAPDAAVDGLVEQLGLHLVVGRPLPSTVPAGGEGGPEVVLFTSGTTGTPKAARHTWASLAARVHRSPELSGARWLLAYSLSAFAGLQVLLHALLNGGAVVLGGDAPAAALRAFGPGITHVSATPTFFRMLLMGGDADGLRPTQLTLGGEPVDQPLLDRIGRRFPSARVTHIYASTEMGTCFSVHDGLAGFPAAYLESDELPVWLTIRDGELHVRSPHAMGGYVGLDDPRDGTGLYPTGDLVEVVGDRVHFRGRRNESINVGGQKVHPRAVEEVLLAEPRVRAARVSGTASSVTGQLVRADVVAVRDTDGEELRKALLDRCRLHLQPHQIPRILRIVDSLEQNDGGKLVRR